METKEADNPTDILLEDLLQGRIPVYKQNLKHFIFHHERYDLSKLDVSQITDMSYLFQRDVYFNQDISKWNVSNVTNMKCMFHGAKKFNQPIGEWDTSRVERMDDMFYDAESFNQDLSNWDVSRVTDMSCMFAGAESFSQDLSNWDVSNVTDMRYMFHGAKSFKQDISKWGWIKDYYAKGLEKDYYPNEKVYLSGSISTNPNYKEEFLEAEESFKQAGFQVFNPTKISIPEKAKKDQITEWRAYMRACLPELHKCTHIHYLNDITMSRGANLEKSIAEAIGLKVI